MGFCTIARDLPPRTYSIYVPQIYLPVAAEAYSFSEQSFLSLLSLAAPLFISTFGINTNSVVLLTTAPPPMESRYH
jgi:hypothetical protein